MRFWVDPDDDDAVELRIEGVLFWEVIWDVVVTLQEL